MAPEGEPPVFHTFFVYRTIAWIYIFGCTRDEKRYQVLKFGRQRPDLEVLEDSTVYSAEEALALKRRLHEGNRAHGGLQQVCRAYALIGCFRFLEGYYLLFVTKKVSHGTLCGGHRIYGVGDLALVPLLHTQAQQREFPTTGADEARYRKVLEGAHLDRTFMFSHSYPVWRSMQRNLEGSGDGGTGDTDSDSSPWTSHRVWNVHLTAALRERAAGAEHWLSPLVHGACVQRTVSIFGEPLKLSLLARRSWRFAGTRYLKRGVNRDGYVANDVEVEQVLEARTRSHRAARRLGAGGSRVSSCVQLRGSVPLFWSQASSSPIAPEITLARYDPLLSATKAHLARLLAHYGPPVTALDLCKRAPRARERELSLGYERAVAGLASRLGGTGALSAAPAASINYLSIDLAAIARDAPREVLPRLRSALAPALETSGIFTCDVAGAGPTEGECPGREDGEGRLGSGCPPPLAPPPALRPVSRQRGVLRTSCVDCLDRTNVAQYAYGQLALGLQLQALGLAPHAGALDASSSLSRALMDAWEVVGNEIARQYGGSEAHAAVFERARGGWRAATTGRALLTALRRFYSNAVTDADKQSSINLLLGNFVPRHGAAQLWELGSDRYLREGFSSGAAEAGDRLIAAQPLRAVGGVELEDAGASEGAAEPAPGPDHGGAAPPLPPARIRAHVLPEGVDGLATLGGLDDSPPSSPSSPLALQPSGFGSGVPSSPALPVGLSLAVLAAADHRGSGELQRGIELERGTSTAGESELEDAPPEAAAGMAPAGLASPKDSPSAVGQDAPPGSTLDAAVPLSPPAAASPASLPGLATLLLGRDGRIPRPSPPPSPLAPHTPPRPATDGCASQGPHGSSWRALRPAPPPHPRPQLSSFDELLSHAEKAPRAVRLVSDVPAPQGGRSWLSPLRAPTPQASSSNLQTRAPQDAAVQSPTSGAWGAGWSAPGRALSGLLGSLSRAGSTSSSIAGDSPGSPQALGTAVSFPGRPSISSLSLPSSPSRIRSPLPDTGLPLRPASAAGRPLTAGARRVSGPEGSLASTVRNPRLDGSWSGGWADADAPRWLDLVGTGAMDTLNTSAPPGHAGFGSFDLDGDLVGFGGGFDVRALGTGPSWGASLPDTALLGPAHPGSRGHEELDQLYPHPPGEVDSALLPSPLVHSAVRQGRSSPFTPPVAPLRFSSTPPPSADTLVPSLGDDCGLEALRLERERAWAQCKLSFSRTTPAGAKLDAERARSAAARASSFFPDYA